MGRKHKHNPSCIKEWPSDETIGVLPSELITPFIRILKEGYRMDRSAANQFNYIGYNIGKEERLYFPSPAERFSRRWLENEAKYKRSLLENVLISVFHMGMEQGRRYSRYDTYNNQMLVDIIKARTKTIHKLQSKLSEYEEDTKPVETPLTSNNADLLIENFLFEEELDSVDPRDTKEDQFSE